MTEAQIRNQILRKIQRISSEKLNELNDFLSKLEPKKEKKHKKLSFAGAWKNIDDSVFHDLTDNLIVNRKKNKRRINE